MKVAFLHVHSLVLFSLRQWTVCCGWQACNKKVNCCIFAVGYYNAIAPGTALLPPQPVRRQTDRHSDKCESISTWWMEENSVHTSIVMFSFTFSFFLCLTTHTNKCPFCGTQTAAITYAFIQKGISCGLGYLYSWSVGSRWQGREQDVGNGNCLARAASQHASHFEPSSSRLAGGRVVQAAKENTWNERPCLYASLVLWRNSAIIFFISSWDKMLLCRINVWWLVEQGGKEDCSTEKAIE